MARIAGLSIGMRIITVRIRIRISQRTSLKITRTPRYLDSCKAKPPTKTFVETHNGGLKKRDSTHLGEIPFFIYYMKRHGNLFNKITSSENLYLAYKNARKGKTWQNTIKIFEKNLDENLESIQESLINKTYTTSPYSIFTIREQRSGKFIDYHSILTG